jgi:hypothetical protein
MQIASNAKFDQVKDSERRSPPLINPSNKNKIPFNLIAHPLFRSLKDSHFLGHDLLA